MLKRAVSMTLALILLLALLPAGVLAAEEEASGEYGEFGDNLFWSLDSEGDLSLTGSGNMIYPNVFNPPWSGYEDRIRTIHIYFEVMSIADRAFAGCSNLESVYIADTVTSIGDRAFQDCENLKSVTFWGEGVTTIGISAFSGCSSLTDISLPDGLTEIGKEAFSGCSAMKSVVIPESVTSIGERAFRDCSGLTSVTLPAALETIEEETFYGCSALTDVTIPEGLTVIGNYAFAYCSALPGVVIPGSVGKIGDYAFHHCGALEEAAIPEGVTEIGWDAFSDSGLTGVTIPSSVTKIANGAFSYCSAMESAVIPDSVTNLANNAFDYCGLSSITVGAGLLKEKFPLSLSGCACRVVIQGDITEIGSKVFSDCDWMTGFTLPESVTVIGEGAFELCSALIDLTIPEGVQTLKKEAFFNCSNLERVTIPDSVEVIGDYAFNYCYALQEVTLGRGVKSIGVHALDPGTGNLKTVRISDLSAWAEIKFGSKDDNPLYRGAKLVIDGKEVTEPVIAEGTAAIGAYVFAGSGITSVTIPASVKSIGYGAFYNCSALTDVYFGGDEAAWAALEINSQNFPLYSAQLHFGGAPVPVTPGAIGSVTATASAGKTTVTWTESEGATAYIIQRRVKDGATWTTLKSNVTGTSYEDATGVAGTVYQYRVRGRNGTEYGPFKVSSVVRAQAGGGTSSTPGAIASVTAKAAAGKTTVSWTASEGAAAYIIQRRVKDSTEWTTLKSNVTGTSYEDATGVAGTVYQYRVRGRNGTVYGPFKVSSVVRAQAGGGTSSTPGAIASVTATASAGKTTVTWTASEGATAYIIQRRVKGEDAWTTLKSNVAGTSYTDTAGVAGTVYQYRVRGRNGTNYGSFKVSSVVRAK